MNPERSPEGSGDPRGGDGEAMRAGGDPAALGGQVGRDVATDPATSGLPSGWDEGVDVGGEPAVVPELAETEVPDVLRAEIESRMAMYPDRHSAALPALAAAQRVHGWCSPEAILQVAAVMRMTPAYLSSLATYYDMLRTEPIGSRYVYVCTSVACHLRDAKAVHDAIAEAAERQGLEDTEIREFECLGACDMAPMASVDGRYVGPLEVSDGEEIVAAMKERRAVLPGRGLEDPEFRLPWESRESPAASRQGEDSDDGEGPPVGPPTPPETHAP